MIILGYLSLPFRQIKRFLAKVGTYTVISGILLLAQFPFILYISHNPTSYITFFRHKYSFLSTCIEFHFVFYSLHLFLGFRNELSIFVMRFLIDLQPNLRKIRFFFCIVSFSRWNLFILYTALLHTNMEMKRNCLFALPILFVLYLDCHQQRILFGFRRIPTFDIMSNSKKKLSILVSTPIEYTFICINTLHFLSCLYFASIIQLYVLFVFIF